MISNLVAGVVGAAGVEPALSWVETRCPVQLGYAPMHTQQLHRECACPSLVPGARLAAAAAAQGCTETTFASVCPSS